MKELRNCEKKRKYNSKRQSY